MLPCVTFIKLVTVSVAPSHKIRLTSPEILSKEIVTHTGVQIGVAHQQFGHPGVVAALRVAVQRVGIVLFQLVVKPAPAEQRFTLFLRVFPIHLPKEKGTETGPEVESLPAVVTQHGGVPQEPVHPFAGTGVAADHPHHFHVKVLKQRKLQQKPPHRKVKAVDRKSVV